MVYNLIKDHPKHEKLPQSILKILDDHNQTWFSQYVQLQQVVRSQGVFSESCLVDLAKSILVRTTDCCEWFEAFSGRRGQLHVLRKTTTFVDS